MKRRIVFILSAALVCAAAVAVSQLNAPKAQSVQLMKIRPSSAQSSVYCSGVVEQTETEDIFSKTTVVIKKVCISEGQYVKTGDVLFEIDEDESRKEIFLADSSDYESASKVEGTICAEKNGYIASVVAEEDTVCPSELALATIIPEKSLCVRISVSEDIVPDVKVGQEVEISGSGFRDRIYTGKISSMTAVAKQQQIGNSTQTVLEAIVDLDKPDEYLKVGFTAKAKIFTNTVSDAIVVPYSSVSEDEDGNSVVYRYADNNVYKQIVKTGVEFDEGIEIVSGLRRGDRIVSDNNLSGDAVAVNVSGAIR